MADSCASEALREAALALLPRVRVMLGGACGAHAGELMCGVLRHLVRLPAHALCRLMHCHLLCGGKLTSRLVHVLGRVARAPALGIEGDAILVRAALGGRARPLRAHVIREGHPIVH